MAGFAGFSIPFLAPFPSFFFFGENNAESQTAPAAAEHADAQPNPFLPATLFPSLPSQSASSFCPSPGWRLQPRLILKLLAILQVPKGRLTSSLLLRKAAHLPAACSANALERQRSSVAFTWRSGKFAVSCRWLRDLYCICQFKSSFRGCLRYCASCLSVCCQGRVAFFCYQRIWFEIYMPSLLPGKNPFL